MNAQIVYKPVCSECGTIIDDEVYGIIFSSLICNDQYALKVRSGNGVYPAFCKKCGAWFSQIVKDTHDIKVIYE